MEALDESTAHTEVVNANGVTRTKDRRLVRSRAMTYSCLSSFTAFLSPDRAISPHQSHLGGLIPAIAFLLVLIGLWMAVLILFVWMHIPEPTIAEIIRGLESRS
jgi:hypothetical protein